MSIAEPTLLQKFKLAPQSQVIAPQDIRDAFHFACRNVIVTLLDIAVADGGTCNYRERNPIDFFDLYARDGFEVIIYFTMSDIRLQIAGRVMVTPNLEIKWGYRASIMKAAHLFPINDDAYHSDIFETPEEALADVYTPVDPET